MTLSVCSVMYTVLGEIRGAHRRDCVHKHLLESTEATEHYVKDSFLQYLFNSSGMIIFQYCDNNIHLANILVTGDRPSY
jgi:hypothetical protein